jgi:hypothetical protein
LLTLQSFCSCRSDAEDIKEQQQVALLTSLKALLVTPGVEQDITDMEDALVASAIPLGSVVQVRAKATTVANTFGRWLATIRVGSGSS